jgi:hypothetical protein
LICPEEAIHGGACSILVLRNFVIDAVHLVLVKKD